MGGLVILIPALAGGAPAGPSTGSPPGSYSLTLSDAVQRVLDYNDSVQEKLLEYAASERVARAQQGVFEPEAYASGSHQAIRRQNNSEQTAASNGVSVLHESNNLYSGGIQATIPTGAKIKAGISLEDLSNNIPPSIFSAPITTGQYQTFAGLSVTQPLLKNFGTAATMAQIRIAALSSKIAFQTYRRELMKIVATTEATYWNLHLAQEQARFFEQSVQLAEKVLRDNRTRLSAGQGSRLDVLEAQAGLGLRRAKLNDALQKVVEARNQLISLFGETASEDSRRIVLVNRPRIVATTYRDRTLLRRALKLSPDYLIEEQKVKQEAVRLGYARNQHRIELDLKGAYGLNGFGDTPYRSLTYAERAGYPTWSFGLELRFPLLGGIKTGNELSAVRLQMTAAEVDLRGLQVQIGNSLDTDRQQMERARSSIDNYRTAVKYNQSLLDAALVQLKAGKIDSRKVLEIESDLFDAKDSFVESQVNYETARLALELVEGSLLADLHFDLTQDQLRSATKKFATSHHWGEATFREALERVHALYPKSGQ